LLERRKRLIHIAVFKLLKSNVPYILAPIFFCWSSDLHFLILCLCQKQGLRCFLDFRGYRSRSMDIGITIATGIKLYTYFRIHAKAAHTHRVM
jgi:hypothetical protein